MSSRNNLVFAFAALALPLSLGACATTPTPAAVAQPVEMYPPAPPPVEYQADYQVADFAGAYQGAPQYPGRQEILSALPDNAPPGECYARVKVPGTGAALPQAPGARWVQNPGPPGSPGPIWCLEPTGAAPVAFEPERFGFIRVLCDDQVTPDRVVGIQRKLHDGGYYQGGYTGRYDAATAQAVTRYQGDHHLNHGGYLSVDTVRRIEGSTTVVVAPRITVAPQITVAQPPVQRTVVVQQPVAQPVYQPPIYQQPIHQPPVYQPPVVRPPIVQPPVIQPQPPVYAPPVMAPPVYQQPYPVFDSSYYAGGYGYQSGYAYQGGYGYGAPAAMASASAYAGRGGASASASASAGGMTRYGNYVGGYQDYGYGGGYYGQGGYGQGYGVYGAGASAAAWTSVGPRPAYAAPQSAIQNGWLTWSGKSYY